MGTLLDLVPSGMPSEKTEKFLIFSNFLKMSFFQFLTYFSSNMLLWDVFGKVKN